jgi:dTDP-4-dehydrorhamnose 3,5-epimerase
MPDFECLSTPIIGCYVLQPVVRYDQRGYFVKTLVKSIFSEFSLDAEFVEQYHSLSHKNVIRGMHFQRPPHDHVKLVYCTAGKVLDAVVDLRQESSSYGKVFHLELSAENAKILYVPKGLAHGFEALEDNTLMMYQVSSEYSPDHDDGVRWSSVAVPWRTEKPIVSSRDMAFLPVSDYISPFGLA